MRLRVFDLNTPWFWLTIFYQRLYGKPWMEVLLWEPHTFRSWWVHFWLWETIPDEHAVFVAVQEPSGSYRLRTWKKR